MMSLGSGMDMSQIIIGKERSSNMAATGFEMEVNRRESKVIVAHHHSHS